jgi:hypothetical protein
VLLWRLCLVQLAGYSCKEYHQQSFLAVLLLLLLSVDSVAFGRLITVLAAATLVYAY